MTIQHKNIFLIISLLIFIISCSSNNDHNRYNTIAEGGKVTALITDPVETLDPAKIIFLTDWYSSLLVFEGLVGYGDNLENVTPLIAERWEFSEGNTKIKFFIRKHIYFQDDACFKNGKGREVTAEDVLYSFKRIANPAIQCPNLYLFLGKIEGLEEYKNGNASTIKGIRIINDYTIEFTLTKPFVSFIKTLAVPAAYIIPKEAVDYYGDNFYKHPVGTGAFRLSLWEPTKKLVFTKNNSYWGKAGKERKPPYLDEVEFKICKNISSQYAELINSENGIIRVSKNRFQRLFKNKNFAKNFNTVSIGKGLGIRFWGFSMDNNSAFAKNKNLRRVIALSYNRNFLTEDSLNFNVLPENFMPDVFFPEGIKFKPVYNPELAKKIISSYMNKKLKLNIGTNIISPDVISLRDGLIQIGIEPEINMMKSGYYNYIINERPDIFRVSMIPTYPDPQEYYSLCYSKSGRDINLMQFNNVQYDSLYDELLVEREKRDEIINKLEEIIRTELPVINVSHENVNYFVFPVSIKGVRQNYIFPDFRFIYIDKHHEKGS